MSQSIDDPELPVLEETADSLDRAAADATSAARRVRRLRGERLGGRPWRDVLGGHTARNLLELLAATASRLSITIGRLRRAIVRALVNDGLRVSQIADALGVSHQRISRILNHSRESKPADQ